MSAIRALILAMTDQSVLPEPLHGNAGSDLALTVQLGDAAPFIRSEFHPRHVLDQHRRASIGLQHDLLDIGDAAQITSCRAP